MTLVLEPADLDLRRFVRPGDRILVAEGAGEPQTLTEALIEQRRTLGGVEVFVGLTLGSAFSPDRVDGLTMRSYGALGQTRRLADAGLLDITPVALGDVPALLEKGALGFDVVLASAATLRDGAYPLGLTALHVPAALRHARTVIVEVNARVPQAAGASVEAARVAAVLHSSRSPPAAPAGDPDPVTRAIAANIASVIDDGATLQLGVGAIADAVCRQLRGHKDLGVHSGMLNDGLVDLMQRGVVTNHRKAQFQGVSMISAVLGSPETYDFVHQNPQVRLEGVEMIHQLAGREPAMVAINGALEVDVWGQVNAETVGGRYVGAIGGQPQFCRAGTRAPDGASVIALPATAAGGKISRIRWAPVERVTTGAADVDIVVTEYGVARLSGKGLNERRKALAAIAHPDFYSAF